MSTTSLLSQKMTEEALANPLTGWTTTEAAVELIIEAIADAISGDINAGGDLSGTYPNPTVVKLNGTSLAGLGTGLLKNTTGTGVPSIAVAGTDFQAPINFAGRKVIYVSKGSAATDTRGSNSVYSLTVPFSSLAAAQAAAVSGDVIVVEPGTFVVTTSIAKDGVDWHLQTNVTINKATEDSVGIFDDGGVAMTFNVTGNGDLFCTTTDTDPEIAVRCINIFNAASVVHIQARDIVATNPEDSESVGSAIWCNDGVLSVIAREIKTVGFGYTCWWINGDFTITADTITGAGNCVGCQVDTAPTGDFYVRANNLIGTGGSVYSSGSNVDAAMWVDALTIRSIDTYSVGSTGANKLYVHTQKLFGWINAAGTGPFYVTADKISAVASVTGTDALFLKITGTQISWITIDHWDPVTFTGGAIYNSSGASTTFILGGYLVGIAGVVGITMDGGILYLKNGFVIKTSANNATNPIIKNSGTLILDNTTLIAEATRAPISATTSQNVLVYSARTNSLVVDADVTEQIGTIVRNALVQ